MTVFVLDNSVSMRWCFEAGAHAYADSVLSALTTTGGVAFVPILWRYEVTSVLARAQLTGQLTARKVDGFLSFLDSFPIRVDVEGSRRIFSDVHDLAISHRLTSYDAAYLELALRRNLPMATLDAELIAVCKTVGVQRV